MMPEPGRLVGPYEIVRALGAGGMGTVYLARDRRLHRQVALKFLQPGIDGKDEDRRLLREARAASALNHPNICQIFDVGGEGAESWIAMEYVEGSPLATSIPPGGLPVDAVIRLAIELARALEHAHQRGIIHRDLKSSNVVCDRGGHPKILDFGISSRLPQAVAHDVTRTDSVGLPSGIEGSLPYMAPEVLRGDAADERSDLWSFGVLLFEMLTGTLPFAGRNAFELATAIMQSATPRLPSTVPAPVSRIVSRLLARNPSERYARAGDVAAAFESVGRPTLAGRRGFAIAAGAVLLAALVVGAAWYVRRFVPLVLSEQRLVSTAETSHRAPSYSPDGSMLAFVAPDAANVLQVWVQNLAQGTTISITSGAASATRPRWSPKGDRIVYAVQGQGIWSTSPLGGTPQRIIERGTNPNFSRDGERLVYEAGRGLWTASADGTNVQEVQGPPPLSYPIARGPAFSPDGSQIAFFHAELGPNGDLWVVPSGGGAARQLTFDTREGGWPVWTTDGRGIVFSSARAGSRTLWQVPAKGGEPIPLTTGAGEDDQPDLSADGRHVAYTNVRNTWELKVRDLDRGTERSLVQRGTEILFPMFSPDGRRLVFFGRADYAVAIFTIGADGSDLRALTGGRELNHQPRWGHDGKDVYFFQARPELSFRKVSALGGPSTSFHPWDWWTTNAPTFDPTGRFIVYCRNRPIGAPSTVAEHTVIHEVATGQEREWPEPHTHPGGWSPDGLSIVGWRHDDAVYVCRVEDGDCRELAKGAAPIWPNGMRRIYFARPSNAASPQVLWSIAEDGSTERREADLGSFRSIDRFFHVSGERLVAWAPFRAGRQEIWAATVRPR